MICPAITTTHGLVRITANRTKQISHTRVQISPPPPFLPLALSLSHTPCLAFYLSLSFFVCVCLSLSLALFPFLFASLSLYSILYSNLIYAQTYIHAHTGRKALEQMFRLLICHTRKHRRLGWNRYNNEDSDGDDDDDNDSASVGGNEDTDHAHEQHLLCSQCNVIHTFSFDQKCDECEMLEALSLVGLVVL